MNEWQSMDCAPRDGTKILIAHDSDGRRLVDTAVYLNRKDIWVSPDGAYGYDPIKWMPLPDPVD